MRSAWLRVLLVCVAAVLPVALHAAGLVDEGNALFDRGRARVECYRDAGDTFAKALEADPGSYEAAWKAARAYRFYADESKKRNDANWKAVCKEYGKLGMAYGEKAIALNPAAVEGNTWYGFSVASYSDSVSVLTALKEGLKDKTQTSFEKAYKTNRMYHGGGPMKALGRFWFVLPWPLQDRKLSVRYLREFQQAFPEDPEGQVYLAETLMKTGEKDAARTLLQQASASGDTYYADWARRLLSDL